MTIINTLPSDVMSFKYLYPFDDEFKGLYFYTRCYKDNLYTLIKRNKQ